MVVTLDSVKLGICSYVDKELVSKMDGLGKWLLGAKITTLPAEIEARYRDMKDELMSMGIASDDDHIDIDRAESILMDVAEKYGKVNEVIMKKTVTFCKDDIAEVVRHIKSI